MITRPVGTVIACLLVHIIYPYLPGLAGVFIFSLIMIALMYCCTPGTWAVSYTHLDVYKRQT